MTNDLKYDESESFPSKPEKILDFEERLDNLIKIVRIHNNMALDPNHQLTAFLSTLWILERAARETKPEIHGDSQVTFARKLARDTQLESKLKEIWSTDKISHTTMRLRIRQLHR